MVVKNVHLYILSIALLVSISALIIIDSISADRLKFFGPTAQIYFGGIQNGLAISSGILLGSLLSVVFLKKRLMYIVACAKNAFARSSTTRKNVVILMICFLFAFGAHAGNILNGYFNMDDFEIIGVSHIIPFSQALLMPHGNDHTIPLFRTEVKVLDSLFGQSYVPYSIFVFIVFALMPFFTYLIFKRLGIDTRSFFIFLILFSGAAGWTGLLTGFYIMSIYIQILFFFCLSAWSYLAWTELKQKKYVLFFGLSIIFALTTDISGIWVLPVTLAYMAIIHHIKFNS